MMNLHTHTCYCDGKDTPVEIVEKAIEIGFSILGFSGHSYTPFDLSYCMSLENTKRYKEEVLELKEKYKGKIKIYCGLELDYFSEVDTDGYDFLIGSVHYVEKNGKFYPVDDNIGDFEKAISAYGGDAYALVEDYYKLVGDVIEKTNADIVGHFDIINKFNNNNRFFDEENPRYTDSAEKALEKLLKTKAVFEINTGAMARGIKSEPYPAQSFLKKIVNNGGKLILSSDCHDKDKLTYGFDKIKSQKDLKILSALNFE